MRMVHKEGRDKTKEYIKFVEWIQKRKVAEQRDVDRRAAKIAFNWEEKYNKLKEENASLKLQLKEEFDKRMLLMDKYDSDSD